jgi:DNA-binding transcriptional regulator LsrR (DeoR family)
MKPSVSIDERGVILHVTDSQGNGVAVPLSVETIAEITTKLQRAKTTIGTPEGKKKLLRGLVALALELTK